MPDNARLWVYQNKKEFTAEECKQIQQLGNEFIRNWSAHGAALKASFDILYKRFIIIAVDEQQAAASGCSIDKSVNFIKELEKQFGINLFDRMHVAFRNKNNEIESCSYSDFENLAKENKIDSNTIVFNNMVDRKSAFLKNWEVPAHNSWHNRVFNHK